jgi:hypothetical protein
MPILIAALLFVLGAPQAAPQATQSSSNVWEGRNGDYEEFLKTAKVVRVTELKIGVTRPKRAFLEPGGLAESFAWKPLPPRMYNGYWESYKSEIAAYELDKLLGLNMVPPVVERRVNNDLGAAVLWLENVRSWEAVLPLPKPPTWGQQLARMKMFDDLIGNSDRNKGNLLVDGSWHLFLIDHSRAFISDEKLPAAIEHVDRALWQKVLALDEPTLTSTIGTLIDKRAIQAMLKRRDKLKKVIDDLVAKNGDSVFF